jgi:hypothetical protein
VPSLASVFQAQRRLSRRWSERLFVASLDHLAVDSVNRRLGRDATTAEIKADIKAWGF